MSDQIFRPQRPGENDMSNELPQHHPLNNNQGMPNAEGAAINMAGKIPQELLDRMQGRQAPSQPQVPNLPAQQFIAPHGSSNELQAILDVLKTQNKHFEEVTLPSGGKFYDGTDGPTDGILHIRPMTGEEEQILATPRFVRKGVAINMIFSRCIQEQYKPENLLSVDRTFLLIYLRGISYGTEYEVEVKDPESDRKFSTVIDLDTLPKEMCPLDFNPPLVDVLPKTNLQFQYRLSRGRDEQELQEHRERKLKTFGDSGADDTLIFRSAQLLESIAGITSKQEIQVILKNLPIQDLAYLRGIINEPPFGVDTKVTILSPTSNEEFEIELPLEANFFFPRRRKKADKTLA